jgi:hypothetical protein
MSEQLTTKITNIITRKNGNQVRIVSELFDPILNPTVSTIAFHRDNSNDNWKLCSKEYHPDVKTMSRSDYMKFGRSELMEKVTFAELAKTANMIGKPLSSLPPEVQVI